MRTTNLSNRWFDILIFLFFFVWTLTIALFCTFSEGLIRTIHKCSCQRKCSYLFCCLLPVLGLPSLGWPMSQKTQRELSADATWPRVHPEYSDTFREEVQRAHKTLSAKHICNQELTDKQSTGLPEVEFFTGARAKVLCMVEANKALWTVRTCQGREEAGGLTFVTLPFIIRQ